MSRPSEILNSVEVHRTVTLHNFTYFSSSFVFHSVKLNGNRHVTGVLRGFDQFMNIVLDGTIDEKGKVELGMVVIRGNSINTIEALEGVDLE